MKLESYLPKDSIVTIGIQGGPGSFNEEAVLAKLNEVSFTNFEIKYFYTTKNVFEALKAKKVSFAHFAIHNSLGGLVQETIDCLGRYEFFVVDTYLLKIQHNLLSRKDKNLEEIQDVMAHPQAFFQCQKTLKKSFSGLTLIVGEGEFIDPSRVAQGIMNEEIPSTTAVIGSNALAKNFNLKTLASHIEDSSDNTTTFLWATNIDAK
jgi:chorismate mutase/prephenate dehydratase